MALKLKRDEMDKVARLCALQEEMDGRGDKEMLFCLRRLRDDEPRPPGIVSREMAAVVWELDVPQTGMTFYGVSPTQAYEEALKGLLNDFEHEVEKATERMEAQVDKEKEGGAPSGKPTRHTQVHAPQQPVMLQPKAQPGQTPEIRG